MRGEQNGRQDQPGRQARRMRRALAPEDRRPRPRSLRLPIGRDARRRLIGRRSSGKRRRGALAGVLGYGAGERTRVALALRQPVLDELELSSRSPKTSLRYARLPFGPSRLRGRTEWQAWLHLQTRAAGLDTRRRAYVSAQSCLRGEWATIPLGTRTLRVIAIRDDDADQPPALVVQSAWHLSCRDGQRGL
jgi:hypothetical protein